MPDRAAREVAVDIQDKDTAFVRAHALIVAVAKYRHVRQLPDVVLKDAGDIASILTSPNYCGYDPKNVTVLLDEAATLANIRAALASLASTCPPDGTATIYFSGHGAIAGAPANPTSSLVPVDCKLDELETTGLSEAEFSSALRGIKAERLVVLLDACHSGGAGSFKGMDDGEASNLGFEEKSLGRWAQGTGRVMIASSRASETSLILPGSRNSLFTRHLLEALRGEAPTRGDGLIRIFEIFTHVAEKVRHSAPGQQHPIFKAGDLEDNFPFALDRGGKKSIAGTGGKSRNRDPWRNLEGILAELYPTGPQEDDVWSRAGGDLSRLRLVGTGRAQWHAALKSLQLGGGGEGISSDRLIAAVLDDFPHHPDLSAFLDSDEFGRE
jgi:hypothetical protein